MAGPTADELTPVYSFLQGTYIVCDWWERKLER